MGEWAMAGQNSGEAHNRVPAIRVVQRDVDLVKRSVHSSAG